MRDSPIFSITAAAGLIALAAVLPAADLTPARAQSLTTDDLWAEPATAVDGPPRVIGGYSNGCLEGASAIPLEGPGHVVIRPQRNRYWGHPSLVALVDHLSHRAVSDAIGVLMIADAAQPRGGPISGHASHEIGLDVDIWLRLLPDHDLSEAERAAPTEMSVLTEERNAIDGTRWTDAHTRLYRAVATYPGVVRIFAHPVIKDHLCRTVTGDRSWLRRVRPWYGHDAHLHIRLACPADSPLCVDQPEVPPGDGCGTELTWWLSNVPFRPTPGATPPPPPPLPGQCASVLAR